MKRISRLAAAMTVAVAAAPLGGCGGSPVDFKHGVPTQGMVNVNMPTSKKMGANGNFQQLHQGLQNEPSVSVGLTRLAVGIVNGSTLWILGAVKELADTPPATVNGNVGTWAPYTPSNQASTYRLTVTRTSLKDFNYIVEGKLKTADDTHYKIVMSGTHSAAGDPVGTAVPGYGHGNFLIDWQAAVEAGGDPSRKAGSAEVKYDHESANSPSVVDVTFNEIPATGGTVAMPVAVYHFKSTPKVGGEFSYGTDLNAHWWDPSHPVMQHWSINSRWTLDGAGRADSILTGGGLTTPSTQSECWDNDFLSQYLINSADSSGWGLASACAFTTPQFAK